MRIETTILKNLIKREDFTRKVLPFLKDDYFSVIEERVLFKVVSDFVIKYNTQPTFDALEVEINSIKGANLTDDAVKNMTQSLRQMKADTADTNIDWLVENTEKFCQERAIYLAITESLEIMNGKSKHGKGIIPELLSNALAVTFDPNIGHDFLEQYEARYAYYHRVEKKIPCDLELFNKAMLGGVSEKTLNIVMGGVHTGKSLVLCHLAAAYLLQGKNVLFLTLEMAQEEVAKRIDANLLNISFDDLMKLPKDLYIKRVQNLKQKTHGRLIIKEYASTTASVIHIKALLNELALKQNFKPDVIMIDYLNIMASSRIKASGAQDTYTYIKSIAEEVRGLAQQEGIPIWSATQLTRSGYNSSDPDMTDTAESWGLPATADLLWVLVTNDQLKQLNQLMVKQLKNRYDDMEKLKRFVVGVDKSKMKLYDVEASAQEDLVDVGDNNPASPKPSFDVKPKKKYEGLKV